MQEAAERGPWLPRLFEPWPAVVVEEMRLGSEPLVIAPEEAEQVASAVLRRRVEFAAGRWLARRALSRLSIEAFALRNGADRAPCWPPAVVGAITHTGSVPGGFCGVAVGRADDYLTLGLDAESSEIPEGSIRSHILTPAEEQRLAQHAPERQAALLKVIFSAKECFYKAQYPLSRRFLMFEDVEIELDTSAMAFTARLTARAPAGLPLAGCQGRYLLARDFAFTGVAIPGRRTDVGGR